MPPAGGPMTHKGTRGLIAGQTRMGKSYFTKKVFIPALEKFKPVVVLDRQEEYRGRHQVDHNKSWKHCRGFDGFLKALFESEGILSGVNVITCNSDIDYIKSLQFIKELQRPVSLVIDEAHDIFLDRDLYEAKKPFVKLIRYGAKFGIDVIIITQRTYDVIPDIRSQFEWLISFHQKHEDDIKAISSFGWDDSEAVRDLEEREFEIFGTIPEHLKIQQKVK